MRGAIVVRRMAVVGGVAGDGGYDATILWWLSVAAAGYIGLCAVLVMLLGHGHGPWYYGLLAMV